MPPRRTFVVQVREDHARGVVVEDVRTGRRRRVADLRRAGEQIARWLAEPGEEPARARREDPVSGSP
jgi:hypothetical protein